MDQVNVNVTVSAVDKMTAVINRAATNASTRLAAFSKKTGKMADASFRTGTQLMATSMALGAPLIAATQKAIDFEEAMADVSKVMNIDNGSAELKKLGEEAQKLGIHLGRGSTEAAGLMASLAAGGIKDDLVEVAHFAGEMGVAFDMSAADAGDRFVKLKNAMALTTQQTKDAANAMNLLSDNDASKAREILDFMSQGGSSAAQSLKMSAAEMSAVGSSFLSIGKSADVAGTTVKRMQKTILNDDLIGNIFKQAGGGVDGFQAVMAAGNKLQGDARSKYFQRFGEYGNEVKELAFNMEKVDKSIKMVSNSSNYANSVSNEFNNRMNTTAGRLGRVKAQLEVAAIKLGEAFLPLILKITERLGPLIERFTKWVERNPKLVKGIMMAVAGLSALAAVGAYVSFVAGGIFRLFSLGSKGVGKLTDAVKWLTDKKKGLGHWIYVIRYRMLEFSQFMSGKVFPIIKRVGSFLSGKLVSAFRMVGQAISWIGKMISNHPIIRIIMLIALAVFLIIKYWDQIKAFFAKLWGHVTRIFKSVVQGIKSFLINFTPVGLIYKHWSKITGFFSNLWQGVKDIFWGVVEWIQGLGAKFYEAGVNLLNSIWEGIKSMVMAPINAVKNMVKSIRNLLPFSPAKEGPLKDIHKIKLVETIADTIKPAPLVSAVKRATGGVFNTLNEPLGSFGSNSNKGIGSGVAKSVVNFTINLNGGTKNDAALVAAECKKQFKLWMKDYDNQENRVKFT